VVGVKPATSTPRQNTVAQTVKRSFTASLC
jgi:hypothetical protein